MFWMLLVWMGTRGLWHTTDLNSVSRGPGGQHQSVFKFMMPNKVQRTLAYILLQPKWPILNLKGRLKSLTTEHGVFSITNVLQGENLEINICKEVLIALREQYFWLPCVYLSIFWKPLGNRQCHSSQTTIKRSAPFIYTVSAWLPLPAAIGTTLNLSKEGPAVFTVLWFKVLRQQLEICSIIHIQTCLFL